MPAAGCSVSYSPKRGGDGRILGVLAHLTDIQQLKDAEEALAERERQLRLVTENIVLPISFIDTDWRFRFFNHVRPDWTVSRPTRRSAGTSRRCCRPRPIAVVDPHLARAMRGENVPTSARRAATPRRAALAPRAPRPDHGRRRQVQRRLHRRSSTSTRIKLAQERARGAGRAAAPLHRQHPRRDRLPRTASAATSSSTGTSPGARHAARQIIGRTTAGGARRGDGGAGSSRDRSASSSSGETSTYEREMVAARRRAAAGSTGVVPDFDEDGSVRGMYVVGHDVTELKDAQEQLAAREEELRFFAENIPEAIVYVDLEARLHLREQRLPRHARLHARVRARQVPEGRLSARADGGAAAAPRPRGRAARPRSTSAACTLRSAQERWVRVSLTPRKDAAGKVLGYYVVSSDIHDIKSAQAVDRGARNGSCAR